MANFDDLLRNKGHFLLFFILTYLGHFLTDLHLKKNNLIVEHVVHSLIDFHKEILKNKVGHSVETAKYTKIKVGTK